jgi:hypothetical protein
MHETIIQARRNPALLSPVRIARAAYGPWCDAVRRLGVLTPTQRDIARLIGWATLRQGFTSLAFRSLTELTQVRAHARPFAGLGKNDLSPALNALKQFGLVKLEERAALESGVPPVTLLLVIADVQQWSVPDNGWLFTLEEEKELLMHLLACRQRWTAQFPELGESADLHDARAALAVESAANALVVPTKTNAAACRGASFGGHATDAREACFGPKERAKAPRRSDFQNAENAANAGSVPTFGTRLTISSETETVSETLPIGSAMPLHELKLAIADGDEREFCAAARQIMGSDWDDGRPRHWQGEGSKWRMRYRDGKSRRIVRAVFLDMIERRQAGGGTAEFRWKQFGGAALDEARLKNFKESLLPN